MVKFNIYRSILTILMLLAALVMPPLSFNTVPANAAESAATLENAGSDLLQFTSAGHVLGFSTDGLMLASASHMLKIDFLNANAVSPQPDSMDLKDTSGSTPDFNRVEYPGLWQGVDLVYEVSPGTILKSTYYIDPEDIARSVEQIRLEYNRPVKLDFSGNLVTAFDTGSITESKPVAWQEVDGVKRAVAASYRLYSDKEVGFTVADYLPGLPLVIDPSITWNTFLGGSGDDIARSISLDSNDNVYITGYSTATWGTPLRAYSAGDDAFVAKLDSNGALTWNTFLGGVGLDYGNGILVSGSDVYVTGDSNSTWGTPLRAYSAGSDAFVAKLDSDGALTWNTFLGGANGDYQNGIAVSEGNIYVVGYSYATWGAPLRNYSGLNDVFVAKLTNNGALTWHTFLGGAGWDFSNGLVVSGVSVYIIGYSYATWGAPLQPYTDHIDAFVAKLTNNGALTWHTFLGGAGDDYGNGIAVSGVNIYITGTSFATWGTPLRAYSAGADIFAAKLDSNGALAWSTFLGANGNDFARGIALDSSDNVYITGFSEATWGTPSRDYSAGEDAYVAKVNANGALTWNTFLGGADSDQAYGIAVIGDNIYITGGSAATWGTPLYAYVNGLDAIVIKLTDGSGGGGEHNPRVGGEFTPINRLGLIVPLMLIFLTVFGSGWLALRRRRVS